MQNLVKDSNLCLHLNYWIVIFVTVPQAATPKLFGNRKHLHRYAGGCTFPTMSNGGRIKFHFGVAGHVLLNPAHGP